ncbi:protein containing DUF1814 [Candidatus Magnetomorum sp. HK-1]|nr:protein containing DUF1814 [Candidatus Magnetomorum sp. HK-1]
MNDAIKNMVDRYNCQSTQEYVNAFKEVMQEVSLLGLWRSNFFEKAAFYGGSALRIFYGLDRFSEDLDFSLRQSNSEFIFEPYLESIRLELSSMGMDVTIDQKRKQTAIQSAFIKANTLKHIVMITSSSANKMDIHSNAKIKVKIELDTNPPEGFDTETKYILQPFPFSVSTFTPSNLFAGKMHAVLCRAWKNRVKGRDWFDMIWFVARKIPVNLKHLEARIRQTGHYKSTRMLTEETFRSLLTDRINCLDIKKAKDDIFPFIKDPDQIAVWSHDFFHDIAKKIITC